MHRKMVGLVCCVALLAALTLSAGCARRSKTVSPTFEETESVTVEVAQPAEIPEERPEVEAPALGEGIGVEIDEGEVEAPPVEVAIPQVEEARELIFEEANRILKPIYFDYDKADLKPMAKAQLERAADWLKERPKVSCQVAGHCDERGTNEYNLALGEKRALAARRYLTSLGINPDRLFTISYGEETPAVEGDDESAWKFNRRDEFKISL